MALHLALSFHTFSVYGSAINLPDHGSSGFAELTDLFQELFLFLVFVIILGFLLRKSCHWQMRWGVGVGLWRSGLPTQPPGTGTTGEGWGAMADGRPPPPPCGAARPRKEHLLAAPAV